MCNHIWQRVNDVRVCMRCGLTTTYDGKILFDRKIVSYKPKRKKAVKPNGKNGERVIPEVYSGD